MFYDDKVTNIQDFAIGLTYPKVVITAQETGHAVHMAVIGFRKLVFFNRGIHFIVRQDGNQVGIFGIYPENKAFWRYKGPMNQEILYETVH